MRTLLCLLLAVILVFPSLACKRKDKEQPKEKTPKVEEFEDETTSGEDIPAEPEKEEKTEADKSTVDDTEIE